MENDRLELDVIEVRQQIGSFFIGKVKAEDLVKLSYSDVRQLSEERDVESYLGIQRPLNRNRAKDIQEYVKNIDATFPTGILLSIENENISYDRDNSKLIISFPEDASPAKILDGQHRIAGFMDLKTGDPIIDACYFTQEGQKIPFELIVTIFVGLDMAEQANIFATVNIKQTKVSKSLVYDLEAYSKTRSPQKTAHEIVLALCKHPKSPFFEKVKRLGLKEGAFESLTQAALVEEIINLITKDAMKDRDYLLRKEKEAFSVFRKGLDRTDYKDNLVFRNAFIEEQDSQILKTVTAFFLAVKNKWPKAWSKANTLSIFNRTVGIYALFRVLREFCKERYRNENGFRVIDQGEFTKYFDSIDLKDEYFENMDAKTATVSKLTNDLVKNN